MNVDSIDLDAGLDVDFDAWFHLHCNEVHHVTEAASWSPGLRRPASVRVDTRNARGGRISVIFTMTTLRRLRLESVDLHNLKYSLQMCVGFLHQQFWAG